MADAFQTLLKINDMKKRAAEQAQAELASRIRGIDYQIDQTREDIQRKENGLDNNSPTIHTDILAFENWKTAQHRHIRAQIRALETLRAQQETLKKDLSKLLVQETSFKRILSQQKKKRELEHDNLRDEANNAIWVQRHRIQ